MASDLNTELHKKLKAAEETIKFLQEDNRNLKRELENYTNAANSNLDMGFEHLYETMAQGVVFLDANGQIVHANPAAEEILGLTFDQMRGVASIDPRWRTIKEDGSPFPGEEHPAMISLKTGRSLKDILMGVFNPKEGRARWIKINSVPRFLPGGEKPYSVQVTFEDITERKRSEDLLRMRIELTEMALTMGADEILRFSLDQAEYFTGSSVSFFHLIDDEYNVIQLQTWSSNTLNNECNVKNIKMHYPIDEAGVWSECVNSKAPIIHNNFEKVTNKKGMPEGHANIKRELLMPIVRNDQVVAVMGIGNKETDYDQVDLETIKILSTFVIDILERKSTEEALIENEAKYRLLAENMADVVWVMDIYERQITYISPSVNNLLGYTPEQIIQKPLLELMTSDSYYQFLSILPERLEAYEKGNDQARFGRFEIKMIREDGQVIDTEVVTSLLVDKNGQITEAIGVTRDISQKKMVEKALLKSESEIRSFYDAMTELVVMHEVVYDESGVPIDYRILDCNPAYTLSTGISRGQAIGALASKLYGTGEPPYLNIYTRVAETREPIRFETEFLPMGKVFDISVISPEFGRFATITTDITEKKQIEFQLAESQRQRLTLLSNLPAMAYRCLNDEHWTMEFVSDGCYPLTGYQPSDLLQNAQISFASIIHPEDQEMVWDSIQRQVESNGPYQVTYRIFTADGTIKWVWEKGRAIQSQTGEIVALEGIIFDYSERIKAEQALIESEGKFRSYIEHSPIGIFIADSKGKYLEVNQAGYQMLGYGKDELLNLSIIDVLSDESYTSGLEHFQELLIQGYAHEDVTLKKKDGSSLWTSVSGVRLSDDRYIAFCIDISERKKAEEALFTSLKNLEKAEQIAHVGHYQIDLHSGDAKWSDEVFRIFGMEPEQGEPSVSQYSDIVHEEDVATLMSMFEDCVKNASPFDLVYRIKRKDGQIRYVHSIAETARDAAGISTKLFGTFQDITEIKEAEIKLFEREQYLNTILQTAQDGIFILNLDGNFLETNEAFCQISGYSRSELFALHLSKIEAMETKEEIAEHIEQVRIFGNSRFETKHQRKSGDIIDVEVSARYIEANQGQIVCFCRDINDRKKSIEALRDSEEKYRSLIESLESVIATIDYNGNFQYMNQIAADSMHGKPEELIGKNMVDLFPEEIAASQLQNIQEVIIYGKAKVLESRSFVAGKPRWYRTSIQPIFGSIGIATHALINSVDITERKEVEIVLEEKVKQRTNEIEAIRQRLQLATQSAEIGIWEWNIQTDQLYWDEQMCSLYGIHPENFGGNLSDWTKAVHPQDRTIMDYLMNSIESHSVFKTEFRIVWPDESIHYIYANSFTLFDDNGNPDRMIGINFDITGQKEQENELRSRENLYRTLFENSNDAIFLMNPNGQIWRTNEKAVDLLGYSIEQITNKTFDEFVIQEERDEIFRCLADLILGENQNVHDHIFKRSNDSSVNVEINLSAVKDSQGRVHLIQAVARDITSRKKVEAILRQSEETLKLANAELARANRAKDEFLANMSHELRTPLNNILALSEILLEQSRGPINDKQKRSIQNIESSGRHLLSLINDILDLSKIQAQKMELSISKISVKDLAQSSINFVKEPAAKKGIHIQYHQAEPGMIIQGDALRLKQIIVNLLGNAVKFTPSGGKVDLLIMKNTERNAVIISVKDTGIGINPEDMDKLFKPFEQIDSSLARHYEGTGLGLVLVKRLTELHHGTVSVDSEAGTGSTFTITIPQNFE